MSQSTRLAKLYSKRDALNNEISLIEAGIKKAAYDACMREQWIFCNDNRIASGKKPITESMFMSGVLADGEDDE